MAALIIGSALMIWPLIPGPFGDALRESGSSFLTLGFFSTMSPAVAILDFVSATAGVVTIALLIGYLPTL